jgi:hypothetical protein
MLKISRINVLMMKNLFTSNVEEQLDVVELKRKKLKVLENLNKNYQLLINLKLKKCRKVTFLKK